MSWRFHCSGIPPVTTVCVQTCLCALHVSGLLSLCLYLGQLGHSWQPGTRSCTWAVVMCVCVCVCVCMSVCVPRLFETLIPAVEYSTSTGCVGTARAKFNIYCHHEWKTELLSVPLCVCVCVCVYMSLHFIYCPVFCRSSQMPPSERSSLCSTRAVSATSLQATIAS